MCKIVFPLALARFKSFLGIFWFIYSCGSNTWSISQELVKEHKNTKMLGHNTS